MNHKIQNSRATSILPGSKPMLSNTLPLVHFPLCPAVHATPSLISLGSWVQGTHLLWKESRKLMVTAQLSCFSGQMGNSDCTFSKGAISGRWQLMAMSQIPVHCRKGGQGCPPTLRLPQCHWRMETSISSKVPVLGQMRKLRPREGRCPAQRSKQEEASQFQPKPVGPGNSTRRFFQSVVDWGGGGGQGGGVKIVLDREGGAVSEKTLEGSRGQFLSSAFSRKCTFLGILAVWIWACHLTLGA